MKYRNEFIIGLSGFLLGVMLTHYFEKKYYENQKIIASSNQSTTIEYIPKENKSDADIDIKIAKPILKIKVNGKTQTIKKSDDEKFVLDKNKIALDQKTEVIYDLKVERIDDSRNWTLGLGYSNHGISGNLTLPIFKPFGSYIYLDQKTVSGGLTIRF